MAEARSGESPKDFVHKLQIAQKEAHETLYWLRLMAEAEMLPSAQLHAITDETAQILRILSAMARNAKRRAGD